MRWKVNLIAFLNNYRVQCNQKKRHVEKREIVNRNGSSGRHNLTGRYDLSVRSSVRQPVDARMKILLIIIALGTAGVAGQFSRPTILQEFQPLMEMKDYVMTALENGDSKLDIAGWFHNILVQLLSTSFPTAVATNISQQCQNDSIHYVHNLYRVNGSWARQMQESSGKIPVGLFGGGNYHADGLFDECLAVRAPELFAGQYCTVFFKAALVNESEIIPFPSYDGIESRRNFLDLLQLFGLLLPPFIGKVEPKTDQADVITYAFPSISFCLPSSCSAEDLGQAVAQLVGSYVFGNYSFVTVTDENYCFKEDNDPPSFDGPDITVIVVLSILGLLVVMATAHDAWQMYKDVPFDTKKDSPFVSTLHCFSMLTNGRKLLSMKVNKASTTNLSCVHGLRVFSTFWIILGHTASIGTSLNSLNPKMVRQDAMTWWFQVISNASIAVDTFLLMSGLLVSYLLLAELERKKGKVNFGFLYLHRYLRLTLVYAIILGFMATLVVYVGTGPNWYNIQVSAYGCRINWWWHFLYINNLFPTDINVQCMEHTWYLALDMQLFILAPLFIYMLWRKSKIGLSLLGFVFIGTIAANFTLFAVFDLMPTIMPSRTRDSLETGLDSDYYYTKPWTRAPPYIVGVWLGWFLHVTKTSQKRTSKIILVAFWTISIAIMGAVVFGLIPYLDEQEVPEINPTIKVFYGSLHRTAWAMCVAWIVYACTRGYGGIVNRFLSWKGFQPLSRLSYCVYLIHYDYLNLFYAVNRKLIYYTFISQLTTYLGFLITVFGLAFFVSSMIEASFLNLEKLVFSLFRKEERRLSDIPKRPTSAGGIDWKTKSFDKF